MVRIGPVAPPMHPQLVPTWPLAVPGMRTMRARIRGAFGVQILACRCVIVSVLGRGFLEPDRACMRYGFPLQERRHWSDLR